MSEYALPSDASLLILDDDGPFRTRLGRAMEQRGFTVNAVESVAEARSCSKSITSKPFPSPRRISKTAKAGG